MITKFKIFESNEQLNIGTLLSKPEVGDYVICKDLSETKTNEFMLSNIGKIIKCHSARSFSNIETRYLVSYDKNVIPEEIIQYAFYKASDYDSLFLKKGEYEFYKNPYYINITPIMSNEIIYWSKDKEDLELILASKKYNL